MNVNEAKKRIFNALASTKERLEGIGVGSETNVAIELPEEEGGVGYIYGGIVVGANLVDDENCLFFPLDAEISPSEDVSEGEIGEIIADFEKRISKLFDALKSSDNKAKSLTDIGEEMYKERDLELRMQVEKIDKETSGNLRMALYAGAMMLLIAAVCIIVGRLL